MKNEGNDDLKKLRAINELHQIPEAMVKAVSAQKEAWKVMAGLNGSLEEFRKKIPVLNLPKIDFPSQEHLKGFAEFSKRLEESVKIEPIEVNRSENFHLGQLEAENRAREQSAYQSMIEMKSTIEASTQTLSQLVIIQENQAELQKLQAEAMSSLLQVQTRSGREARTLSLISIVLSFIVIVLMVVMQK